MAKEFMLTILTPQKRFLSSEVEQVIFDTPKGRIGLMADHMPMVAAVAYGIMEICVEGKWRTAAVGQGFAEVGHNMAEFFVDSIEWAEDIDTARAREALRRAEQRLRNDLSRIEVLRNQAAMARAIGRLKAAGRQDKHIGHQ